MTTTTRLPRALQRHDGGRWGLLVAVVGGWSVIGALGVAVAGRMLSAPPAPLGVVVTFLPYLYGALAVLLVVGWALFPARRAFAVGLIALAAAAFAMWSPPGAPPPAAGAELRVMSWNLRRLWGGPDDGGDPTACASDALASVAPDVVTLLEVSAKDVEQLSRKAGLRCIHHAYTEGGGPKEGGLATCTRGEKWALGDGKGMRFVDDENWYYVGAEVRGGERVFNVLAVHLFPYRYVARTIRSALGELTKGDVEPLTEFAAKSEAIVRSQSDQSAALLERVQKFKDPTVIGGDFNSTRDSALHAALRSHGLTDAYERGHGGFGGTVFLFDWIPLRIDYVYASDAFGVRTSDIPDLGCSDHRPVVSDLVLR
jgi:endonuclease/exonuclease/phosphatase (EEP) superfamily protein YafD